MHAESVRVVAQVKRQVLGEGLDRCLGGVVGWVGRWVGDALLGAGDDDGGGVILRGALLQDGQEGGDAVDDPEEVGVEEGVEVGGVLPAALKAHSGVEGEEVNAACVSSQLATTYNY